MYASTISYPTTSTYERASNVYTALGEFNFPASLLLGKTYLYVAVYASTVPAKYDFTSTYVSCPNNCGGRGVCSFGICYCYPIFSGNACENNICPQTKKRASPFCDLANCTPGTTTFVPITNTNSNTNDGTDKTVTTNDKSGNLLSIKDMFQLWGFFMIFLTLNFI